MKPDITALTPEQAAELLQQLQVAQRISVAVYHRMLRLFDELGASMGGQFLRWHPAETDRPPMSTTAPSGKWAWDLLPLYASVHHYLRCASSACATAGDQALRISCYLDEGFRRSQRSLHQPHGEPDPLSLPLGEASLTLNLWHCQRAGTRPISALVDEQVGLMQAPTQQALAQSSLTQAVADADPMPAWRPAGDQLLHWRLQVPLAQLFSEPHTVLALLRDASEHPTPPA